MVQKSLGKWQSCFVVCLKFFTKSSIYICLIKQADCASYGAGGRGTPTHPFPLLPRCNADCPCRRGGGGGQCSRSTCTGDRIERLRGRERGGSLVSFK